MSLSTIRSPRGQRSAISVSAEPQEVLKPLVTPVATLSGRGWRGIWPLRSPRDQPTAGAMHPNQQVLAGVLVTTALELIIDRPAIRHHRAVPGHIDDVPRRREVVDLGLGQETLVGFDARVHARGEPLELRPGEHDVRMKELPQIVRASFNPATVVGFDALLKIVEIVPRAMARPPEVSLGATRSADVTSEQLMSPAHRPTSDAHDAAASQS